MTFQKLVLHSSTVRWMSLHQQFLLLLILWSVEAIGIKLGTIQITTASDEYRITTFRGSISTAVTNLKVKEIANLSV